MCFFSRHIKLQETENVKINGLKGGNLFSQKQEVQSKTASVTQEHHKSVDMRNV